jgi:hypothetical protein
MPGPVPRTITKTAVVRGRGPVTLLTGAPVDLHRPRRRGYLGIAVIAAWRNLREADPGVEGGTRPLDFAGFTHAKILPKNKGGT